jgi:hypothetical protein
MKEIEITSGKAEGVGYGIETTYSLGGGAIWRHYTEFKIDGIKNCRFLELTDSEATKLKIHFRGSSYIEAPGPRRPSDIGEGDFLTVAGVAEKNRGLLTVLAFAKADGKIRTANSWRLATAYGVALAGMLALILFFGDYSSRGALIENALICAAGIVVAVWLLRPFFQKHRAAQLLARHLREKSAGQKA